MTPASYDAWYDTPRGRWIGDREFALLVRLLDSRQGETLLDVGCGSGYFSRRFAREAGLKVTGIDSDPDMIAFAREKASDVEFTQGDAKRLPFADASFDHVVAVTSLCFVSDEQMAIHEMTRVVRRHIALGLLNRRSLLHLRQGRRQSGGYAGARWHSVAEARALLEQVGCKDVSFGSAIFLPGGGTMARMVETCLPPRLPFGGFLAVTAARRRDTDDRIPS